MTDLTVDDMEEMDEDEEDEEEEEAEEKDSDDEEDDGVAKGEQASAIPPVSDKAADECVPFLPLLELPAVLEALTSYRLADLLAGSHIATK